MAALSHRLTSLAALVLSGDSARIARKRGAETLAPTSKFISGVPVLNYDLAYEGKASLGAASEQEQEWVVMMKPGTSRAQMEAACQLSTHDCNRIGDPKGVPFIELRGTEGDLEGVIAGATGAVKYVEPDQEVSMIPEIESDEVEASTWGLTRIGADQRGRTGAGVTIFVLDTGVRVSHQEFTGRAAPALDVGTGTPVECQPGDARCAADGQGHGTHCAGSAAGASYGVAPTAAVRTIKVLGDSGAGEYSYVYSALNWLALHRERPAVASMSLGGRGKFEAMRDAVDGAVQAGITVVVAGGNSNFNACEFSPAFVPSAITVGSTTSNDEKSSFSNFGSCVNLWAPGSDVRSAAHTSDFGSTVKSGTSMACPHVAGGAALLLAADPTMKSSAVYQKLLDTSIRNVLKGIYNGGGETNALLYIAEGGAPPTPVPTPVTLHCDPEKSEGPLASGDCRCKMGTLCHEGGMRECTYSYTPRSGFKSVRSHLASCTDCECVGTPW